MSDALALFTRVWCLLYFMRCTTGTFLSEWLGQWGSQQGWITRLWDMRASKALSKTWAKNSTSNAPNSRVAGRSATETARLRILTDHDRLAHNPKVGQTGSSPESSWVSVPKLPARRASSTVRCNTLQRVKPDQLIQGSQKPGPSQLLLRLSARRRSKNIGGNWRPLLSQSLITEHSNPAKRRRFAGFPTSTHRLSACCIARDSS